MTDSQLSFEKLAMRISILGAIFVVFAGSALHFVYGWSGNNFIVGLFAPINESPWEHMKMVFVPMCIFAFAEYIYLKKASKNYCFSLLSAQIYAIFLILLVFYSYTSVIKHSILAVDISSFVIAVILARIVSLKIIIKKIDFSQSQIYSSIMLLLIAGFFILATINPPHINVFQDPNDLTYGINKLK